MILFRKFILDMALNLVGISFEKCCLKLRKLFMEILQCLTLKMHAQEFHIAYFVINVITKLCLTIISRQNIGLLFYLRQRVLGQKHYKCTICDKVYQHKNMLGNHIQLGHKNFRIDIEVTHTNLHNIICSLCNKIVQNRSNMQCTSSNMPLNKVPDFCK